MADANSKPDREPIAERNLDGYGSPLISWTKVQERFEEGFSQRPGSGGPDRHTCWLATVNPDGTPHVMPLGARWLDGAFYFTAGAATRKARNLAHDPHCVITVATHDFDLIVEGKAARVTDQAKTQRIAEIYKAGGWDVTVSDSGVSINGPYSAPSAGSPPWDVYEVTPEKVYALGTAEPYGATSWRFA